MSKKEFCKSNKLTAEEVEELSHCERRVQLGIEIGQKAFVEAGRALKQIRGKRLYKQNYGTFESYCQHRWDFGRTYAHRLIKACDVFSNFSDFLIKPANDLQIRLLSGLSKDLQRLAWEEAIRIAAGGIITNIHATEAIRRVTNRPPLLPQPEKGFLYIIKIFENRHKLGYSRNIEQRVLQFQTPLGEELQVVGSWSCLRSWEQAAIDSVTRIGCIRLSAEVYEIESIDEAIERADNFFALMPRV